MRFLLLSSFIFLSYFSQALPGKFVWSYYQPEYNEKLLELNAENYEGSMSLSDSSQGMTRSGSALGFQYKYGFDDFFTIGIQAKYFSNESNRSSTQSIVNSGISEPFFSIDYKSEGLMYGFILNSGLFRKKIKFTDSKNYEQNNMTGGFFLEPYLGYQMVIYDFLVGAAYHYRQCLDRTVEYMSASQSSILTLKGGNQSDLKLFTEYYSNHIYGLELTQREVAESYFLETAERMNQNYGVYFLKAYIRFELKEDLDLIPYFNYGFKRSGLMWDQYSPKDIGLSILKII